MSNSTERPFLGWFGSQHIERLWAQFFDLLLSPRGKPISPDRTQADNGLTHLGFASNDINADYERLKERGVKFYNKPIQYRPNVWNVYFYGPDGETGELGKEAMARIVQLNGITERQ